MSAKINILGNRYGRLQVIAPALNLKKGRVRWLCKCDCGTECTITADNLMMGRTKSCGCLRIEQSRINLSKSTKYQKVA